MGFYTEQIVPRATNVMLGSHSFGKLVRSRVCTGLAGDASGVAMKLAAKRIAAASIPVHAAGLDGARLDLPDDRFDAALSTMTLCTIPDVATALRELRRVLKSGASFHFAEHGHAPDAKVARTQARFNGFQQRVAGGCHLNRDIPALLTDAGFAIEDLDSFYLPGGPKAWGHMYVGTARTA